MDPLTPSKVIVSTWKVHVRTYIQTDRQTDGRTDRRKFFFFWLFCLLRHPNHENLSKGENFLFFSLMRLQYFFFFTYSVCDEKLKTFLIHQALAFRRLYCSEWETYSNSEGRWRKKRGALQGYGLEDSKEKLLLRWYPLVLELNSQAQTRDLAPYIVISIEPSHRATTTLMEFLRPRGNCVPGSTSPRRKQRVITRN